MARESIRQRSIDIDNSAISGESATSRIMCTNYSSHLTMQKSDSQIALMENDDTAASRACGSDSDCSNVGLNDSFSTSAFPGTSAHKHSQARPTPGICIMECFEGRQ